MKLKPEQLNQHLDQCQANLQPVYLLSGDEPLLVQEAADQLRQKARDLGFSERTQMHAESGFQWEQLLDEANSLSLFAERKIIELHIPNGKPGTRGSEMLLHYCENPSADNLLIILMPRLEGSAQNSKWFKVIEKIGVTLAFWPIEIEHLPRWINQRLQQQGLAATPDAAAILADRVEGNLLAAVQEIEKLKLLVEPGQRIDEDSILQLVADSARFDLFSLNDAALKGDRPRCLRMLQGLQAEGSEPTLILWSLSRDIRLLLNLIRENGQGPVNEALFKRHRVWGKRKNFINQAINRHSIASLNELLQLSSQADKAIKGIIPQSPWLLLTDLCLKLAQPA